MSLIPPTGDSSPNAPSNGRTAMRVGAAILGFAALLYLIAEPAPTAAESYREAMEHPDYESARVACAQTGKLADPCALAAVDRFARYEDCDGLKMSEECYFLQAERLGREGRAGDGLTLCHKAGQAATNCDDHLTGILASKARTLPEAEHLFDLLTAEVNTEISRELYLTMWFHNQRNGGRPVDPLLCADQVCRDAAAKVLRHPLQVGTGVPLDGAAGAGPR